MKKRNIRSLFLWLVRLYRWCIRRRCRLCCSLDGAELSYHLMALFGVTLEDLVESSDAGCFGCSIQKRCMEAFLALETTSESQLLATSPPRITFSRTARKIMTSEFHLQPLDNALEVYSTPRMYHLFSLLARKNWLGQS